MIRVLIAEDQTMVRGALASLLTLEPDIEVVAQVASGDEVVAAATAAKPDVALLDIEMPGRPASRRRSRSGDNCPTAGFSSSPPSAARATCAARWQRRVRIPAEGRAGCGPRPRNPPRRRRRANRRPGAGGRGPQRRG